MTSKTLGGDTKPALHTMNAPMEKLPLSEPPGEPASDLERVVSLQKKHLNGDALTPEEHGFLHEYHMRHSGNEEMERGPWSAPLEADEDR